jgi:hypothetical protein
MQALIDLNIDAYTTHHNESTSNSKSQPNNSLSDNKEGVGLTKESLYTSTDISIVSSIVLPKSIPVIVKGHFNNLLALSSINIGILLIYYLYLYNFSYISNC